jgi:HD superfamily phosphodiesterase
MPDRIADIEIPDSILAKAATRLVREAASPLLFDHSRRVFLFGSLAGIRRGLAYDPELLYIGAMFHDLGLTESYRTTDQRFEIDSADAARRFLTKHGVPEDSARIVWEAIALHTTPEVPHHMAPEIALVTTGVEADVLGIGLDEIPEEARAGIVAAHPRPDFKRRILVAFTEGNVHRPQTTFGNVNADVLERFVPGFVRPNFVEIIENSAWPE